MENFDELASIWDEDPRRIERAKIIACEITKLLPNSKIIKGLEFGCGTGLLSFNLQPYLKHITLVDTSQGMLNVVEQKINTAKIENMTTQMLDFSKDIMFNEKFDIIYTVLVLHHIKDIDNVIKNFSRIINKSGYVCIVDLDEEDGSFHGEGFDGHKGFNRNELIKVLEKNGFIFLSCKTCYNNKKRMKDGTEKSYPLFLLVGQKEI